MTDDQLAAVRARLSYSRGRVKVIDVPGGERVVAKQQRTPRAAWRARAFNVLPRAFGLALLQAAPDEGGAKAQAIEVARLRALAAAGARVPPVRHVEDAFFIMGYVDGTPLPFLIEAGGNPAFEAWQQGLAALVDVHRKGHCLSQAFARNFIAARDGLTMIDFEDDPLAVMSLADAQARDWLAYLHSTVWMLEATRAQIRGTIAAWLGHEAPDVQRRVRSAGRRLAALRFLPRSRRAFGREVVGAQALASVFAVPSPA